MCFEMTAVIFTTYLIAPPRFRGCCLSFLLQCLAPMIRGLLFEFGIYSEQLSTRFVYHGWPQHESSTHRIWVWYQIFFFFSPKEDGVMLCFCEKGAKVVSQTPPSLNQGDSWIFGISRIQGLWSLGHHGSTGLDNIDLCIYDNELSHCVKTKIAVAFSAKNNAGTKKLEKSRRSYPLFLEQGRPSRLAFEK